MRKWSIQNTEALDDMIYVYILLYVPPGFPFTTIEEKIANKLKVEGVGLDDKNYDRPGRAAMIQDMPAHLFNAR